MDKNSVIVDSNIIIDIFDRKSRNHEDAHAFIERMVELQEQNEQVLMVMPAHGKFEIQCALKNIDQTRKSLIDPIIAGKMAFPLELIHIDDSFIEKYQDVEIPYIKAMDHIFVVVAKKNGIPLVTSDEKMYNVAKEAGVKVYKPSEYLRGMEHNT